ncbi:hypothetical protein [Burkholderia ubonensis]|uniref:hypothetical protein n=1 Tax=Burkholderia ubonensis TaxID=101571 RepID=UPI0012F7CA5E|nr:hypothetical protein [Burkholderia ubonensis]
MRLSLAFSVAVAVAATAQTATAQSSTDNQSAIAAAIKSGNPDEITRAVLGNRPECPPGMASYCSQKQYELDKRRADDKLTRDLLNIDVESAKRKWTAAKDAYKKNPTTDNELAVTEADARLRSLIDKRARLDAQ